MKLWTVSQKRDVVISSFGLIILVARIKLNTKDELKNVKIRESS
jgi:hypothetical protein